MSQLLQFYKYAFSYLDLFVFNFHGRSFQQARAPASKPAPTFEDLTIDDKLTEHQRLIRYAKSSIGLQRYIPRQFAIRALTVSLRLVHVKMIADVATSIG